MGYDIDELKKSMVKIINPDTQSTAGSGFIIHSDGYFITCHHVIYRLNSLKVEYQGQVYNHVQWCEDLSNPDVDIAILKINLSGAKAVPIINLQDVSTSVTVYGFSLEKAFNFRDGSDFHAQSIHKSASVNTLSTYEYKDKTFTNSWNKLPNSTSTFEAYRINVLVDSGTSGGPVLANNLNAVVGVIQSKGSNESYVIRWDNITESLKKLGLEPGTGKVEKGVNDIDRRKLIELLINSERTTDLRRETLCEDIRIDIGNISYESGLSRNEFAKKLINRLFRNKLEESLCRLCEILE
ncbi:S1 family peptidase [Brasilonema bromeliae]|uniref:Serine protease n=1 Tax=Brasilonema bromeliae SPC951 TaxID=385972 RepID=A0ABX1P8A6_9CYAN|nr:serine protease [Brasilonema bromeliae]NMG20654.1 hypothetical protein [Brasilonema bromeliae SPC951]